MNRLNKPKTIGLALSLALQTMLFCLLANIAVGQTTKVNNLTFDEFKKRVNDLAKQGFRPVKIGSKELTGFEQMSVKPAYWGEFVKVPNGPPWKTVTGQNAAHYQEAFTRLTGEGYVPTGIDVGCFGSRVLYCAIFEKIPNAPAIIARHNIDNATFQKENATAMRDGYKLKVRSSCNGHNAAIWQK